MYKNSNNNNNNNKTPPNKTKQKCSSCESDKAEYGKFEKAYSSYH